MKMLGAMQQLQKQLCTAPFFMVILFYLFPVHFTLPLQNLYISGKINHFQLNTRYNVFVEKYDYYM